MNTATPTKKTKKKRKQPETTQTDPHKIKKPNTSTEDRVVKTPAKGTGPTVSTGLPSSQGPDLSQIKTKRNLRTPFGAAHQAKPKGRTLDSPLLLARTGSLADLLPQDDAQWSKIAQNLNNVFAKYIKDEIRKAELTGDESRLDYAELCTVYYTPDGAVNIKDLGDAQRLNEQSPGQLKAIVGFLQKFMNENGQWDYINNQEWAKDGTWAIGIDVNYYPDRSEFTGFPAFHKDSGGNNLFVNLIFDNKKQIEATEWFPDLAQPSKARREWQSKLLPKSLLAALDLASESLRARFKDSDDVFGGKGSARHTFLSWVDDLVWHSTPSATKRVPYTADKAIADYPELGTSLFKDDSNEHTYVLEILGTLADSPDTELFKWLDTQGLGPQDLDLEKSREAWKALYAGTVGGKEKFENDAKMRGGLPNWLLTGAPSEATAQDDRLKAKNSKSISETPVGLSKRRRANSLNSEAIRKLREENAKVPRSFIRTWVRILPTKDAEQEKAMELV